MKAYDLSFAWPTLRPQTFYDLGGVLVLVYTGNARPDQVWIDEARVLGLGVAFVHQDDRDDWRGGFVAAVERAQRGEQLAAGRGYPGHCPMLYAISDRNSGDPTPGDGAAIAQYAQGLAAGSTRPFIVYSNAAGIAAAMAGTDQCLGGWCPSTWGMDPSHLMIQHAGNPGTPYYNDAPEGSDLNTIQHPFAWWGANQATAPTGDDVIRVLTGTIPDVALEGSLWIAHDQRWEKVDVATPGVPVQPIDPTTFMTIRGDQDALRSFLANPPTGGASGGPLVVTLTGTATPP